MSTVQKSWRYFTILDSDSNNIKFMELILNLKQIQSLFVYQIQIYQVLARRSQDPLSRLLCRMLTLEVYRHPMKEYRHFVAELKGVEIEQQKV